jgi:hypothetical protein
LSKLPAVTDGGITAPPLLNEIAPLALIVHPPTPLHVVHPVTELYADVELSTTTEPGEDGFSSGTNTVPLK